MRHTDGIMYWTQMAGRIVFPPQYSRWVIEKTLVGYEPNTVWLELESGWDSSKNHFEITFMKKTDLMEYFLMHHETVDAVAK